MLERKERKRSKVKLVKRQEKRGLVEDGGEKGEDIILLSTSSKVRRK